MSRVVINSIQKTTSSLRNGRSRTSEATSGGDGGGFRGRKETGIRVTLYKKSHGVPAALSPQAKGSADVVLVISFQINGCSTLGISPRNKIMVTEPRSAGSEVEISIGTDTGVVSSVETLHYILLDGWKTWYPVKGGG
jgi:hypothetical protein